MNMRLTDDWYWKSIYIDTYIETCMQCWSFLVLYNLQLTCIVISYIYTYIYILSFDICYKYSLSFRARSESLHLLLLLRLLLPSINDMCCIIHHNSLYHVTWSSCVLLFVYIYIYIYINSSNDKTSTEKLKVDYYIHCSRAKGIISSSTLPSMLYI